MHDKKIKYEHNQTFTRSLQKTEKTARLQTGKLFIFLLCRPQLSLLRIVFTSFDSIQVNIRFFLCLLQNVDYDTKQF